MECILVGASLAIYTSKHREPIAGGHGHGQLREGVTTWEGLEILLSIVRILLLFALIFLYALFVLIQWPKVLPGHRGENGNSSESTSLLNGHRTENGIANDEGYGTTPPSPIKQDKTDAEGPGWARKDKIPTKSWWEYLRGYGLFLPYLWPAKSPGLQASFVVCILLVVAQRVVNVLVPYQAGKITNLLSGKEGASPGVPWGPICVFILYRFMQGSSGLLGAIRASLWVPIGQYSYRELSTASFEHVHGLSLDFHLGKKTGEVISALSKGNSINNFLDQLTFQLGPMLVDLVVAFGYFLVAFDAYYALVVAVVMCVYVYATVRLAQWRVNVRREMTNLDRQMDAVK